MEQLKLADPKLLDDQKAVLKIDEIRQIYFNMMQDKYDLTDIKKLRKAMKVYYPNTDKRLSERKIREILETQKDTLSLERI